MADASIVGGLHFGVGGHRPDAGHDHGESGRDCQPPHAFGYWTGAEASRRNSGECSKCPQREGGSCVRLRHYDFSMLRSGPSY